MKQKTTVKRESKVSKQNLSIKKESHSYSKLFITITQFKALVSKILSLQNHFDLRILKLESKIDKHFAKLDVKIDRLLTLIEEQNQQHLATMNSLKALLQQGKIPTFTDDSDPESDSDYKNKFH